MKIMPPQKKREREASTHNGSCKNDNLYGNSTISPCIDPHGAETGVSVSATASMHANIEPVKLNGYPQEQELFLQAFEKPTQIYRFLRNRHLTSPIFLQRTLSYMKERMSRSNKKRSSYKVNSMLESITQRSHTLTSNYFNIIYNGLYESDTCSEHNWQNGDVVAVECTLYRITKSKRKDSTSDFQEILSFNSDVVYNPHDNIEQLAAISIAAQSMHQLGDQHTIYKIIFRVKMNTNISNGIGLKEETPTKRSKYSHKVYGCELIVYDKNIGCLPEGDYEAALQELNFTSIKTFSPKKRTWESLPNNYIPDSMKFDVFSQFPTLKFRLTWTESKLPEKVSLEDVENYSHYMETSINNGPESISEHQHQENINNNNICSKDSVNANDTNSGSVKETIKSEKVQLVYNFLYNNNTRQQTEYTQEVLCPWCSLDCMRLYSLLKHLKLCHARFNFTYQPAGGNGARIDVTINDAYDGSYAGSPYDLAGPSGCSFARTCGPVRRTSVTNLLVCRPRRQKTCLDEFLVLDEDDLSNQRPYITGHNRLYHHTETCLPVHPKELDIDSEGESDPLWLRQKTIQMIDEFTDVNEGEKELMKLWNLHVMKHGFVGDCQLPLACEMFLDVNGHEIIRKNIYRNFILHMCTLFDYGLVSPETLYKVVQKLQGILSKYAEGQEMMSRQRETQLKYWLDVGIHKQDEQKLKSPQKYSTIPLPPPVTISGSAVSISKKSSMENCSNKNSSMQPPSKRSNTAIKRSSSSASLNDEKSLESKGVARKSALSHDDEMKSRGTSIKNNDGNRSRFGNDSKSSPTKRRFSPKDNQQPTSKRSRYDYNNTAKSTTRNYGQQNHNQNNNQKKSDKNQERIATRRQSIACLPIAASETINNVWNSMNNTDNKLSEFNRTSGRATTTGLTLRTRFSMPITNKVEKR